MLYDGTERVEEVANFAQGNHAFSLIMMGIFRSHQAAVIVFLREMRSRDDDTQAEARSFGWPMKRCLDGKHTESFVGGSYDRSVRRISSRQVPGTLTSADGRVVGCQTGHF